MSLLALILGGGKGKRLFPLTLMRAKPAVPVGGSFRLVDIPLSNCINSGIQRIFVLTQFNSASLNRHIAQTYKFDLFSRGWVDILAASQTPTSGQWYQGTADAVRQNLTHFQHLRFQDYLILAGDHLYRMDYRPFYQCHQESHADVTIAVLPRPKVEAQSFGVLQRDREGKVEKFIEKPDKETLANLSPEVYVSMGIYIFMRSILEEVLKKHPGEDFGREILPWMLSQGYHLQTYGFSGYWQDVGTIKSYYEANLALTQPHPPFKLLDSTWPFYTHPRFLGISIVTDSHLDRVILAEGSVIQKAKISQSVVGLRSRIREGSIIERSLILGNDYTEEEVDAKPGDPPLGIGRDVVIRGAIVDKNVRIGDKAHIENRKEIDHYDGEQYYIRDGIIIIPKGGVIPPGSRIGL